MKKRFTCAILLLCMVVLLCCSGCGVYQILDGTWLVQQEGDKSGNNFSQLAVPYTFRIYSNGNVDMLGEFLGTYELDRSTFIFTGYDSEGSFTYKGYFNVRNRDTIVIILDDAPYSYLLERQ